MNKNLRKGFTLIEILIVVAIIAILASVVLVGLGPTQQAARDSKRISDVHEVQNGLELYYNANGAYPIEGTYNTWGSLTTELQTVQGVGAIPNDPTAGANYFYGSTSDGTQYVVGADMELATGNEWNNYIAPGNMANMSWTQSSPTVTCEKSSTPPQYCVTL